MSIKIEHKLIIEGGKIKYESCYINADLRPAITLNGLEIQAVVSEVERIKSQLEKK